MLRRLRHRQQHLHKHLLKGKLGQEVSPSHNVSLPISTISNIFKFYLKFIFTATSRSTSPSSRIQSVYTAYRQTGAIPKKTSGIPRSLANSREASPTRTNQYGSLRRNMYSTGVTPRRTERPPVNPGRPVLAQKMLQASREAENALADALSPTDDHDVSSDFSRLGIHRKTSRDESDESEASSVCSERSFDSYRRGGEPYSWNGSRSRLDNSRVVIEDIELIIQYCASSHWSERKDGLISLTEYLSQGRILNSQQLQVKTCIKGLYRDFQDSFT